MLILGIETTCDETSIAIVRNGSQILSHKISSQIDLHKEFGGVVPELACRRHIEVIEPLLKEAIQEAKILLSDIDLIAVAKGPGLIGALLIGIHFAKGLAWSLQKPLIGINHLEAHIYAAMMDTEKPITPSLGVILSGGHTSLLLIEGIGKYKLIGETIDDAIGEAFDKVAKILNLPYPGGPEIERLASCVNSSKFSFKPPRVKEKPLYFSFSGMKTSVLYTVKGHDLKKEPPSLEEKKEIAFAFQETVFLDLLDKIDIAIKNYPIKALYLGGGVTSNQRLRKLLKEKVSLPTFFPKDGLSLDNGAMIAGIAFHKYKENPSCELLTLEAETRIAF